MKRFIIFCIATMCALGATSAHAEFGIFDAKRLIDNGCSELRNKANFTISPKCDFRVTDMALHQSTDGPAADITVYSKGFLYDIGFVARYKLNASGDHQLVDVYKLN